MKTIVYAASDATFIEIDSAKFWSPPETFVQAGKVHRRLTPEYWAWFYHKFTLMEQALTRGKISEATFVEILDRISKLYNHAVALYGKEMLDAAVRTTDVREIDKIIRNRAGTAPEESAPTQSTRKQVPSLVVERG
ncbi:MAG TPA: hypothetical protein PKH33_13500 [bacterium]|nr:hypothetical protein [bacterium]